MAGGVVVEKPLVTCFKGTNGNYIVLDNESNGSMGLPIIIISRLNGANLEKILDPNEWGAVKDNLKTIIGGTALPYLPVPEAVNAPNDFYTQLTLPVASFDLLKSVYAVPAEDTSADASSAAATPVEPVAPAPVAPIPDAPAVPTPEPVTAPAEITLAPAPEVPVAPTPVAENSVDIAPITAPVIDPAQGANVAPVVMAPEAAVAPVDATPAPVTPAEPVAPVAPAPVQETPVVDVPVTPVVPEVPATTAPAPDASQAPAVDLPEMQAQAPVSVNNDIETLKETFMKSCENMFDALVKKFNNK